MATYNFDNYTTVNMNGTEMFQVKYGTTVVYNKTLINFDVGNGSAVSNKYAYYNRVYGTLPTSSRLGHTFEGWFTGANQTGSKILSTTILNSIIASQTLYAAWTPSTYTVTFDPYYGTTPNPTSKLVTYGSTYGTLPTTSRTGHAFMGWINENGSQILSNTIAYITSDQTLTARWIRNTYTVSFNSNGGSTPSPTSKSVEYSTAYGTLPTVSRTGHTFNGWFTAASGGTQIISTTQMTQAANHTLYAQWTLITYTVTFDPYGGTTPNPTSKLVTPGSTYGTLPTTSRTGHTFNGWIDENGSQKTADTIVSITSDQTLFARWVANNYTVSFNSTGGSSPSPGSKTVTYGSTYGTLPPTSRANYTFKGWFTAASGGTQIISTTQMTQAANHTLYAQWTGNTYTVVFNANGGVMPSPQTKTVTLGSTYGTLATTSRAGFVFKGWFTAASGGTQITETSQVTRTINHTLYAQWQAATPTWAFESESSSPYSHVVQMYVSNWANRVAEAKQYLDNNYPATGFVDGYAISVQVEMDIYLDFRVRYL